MFIELSRKSEEVARHLNEALELSVSIGLSPDIPQYRALSTQEVKYIYSIIDKLRSENSYDGENGMCLVAHTLILSALRRCGIKCEIIYGTVMVNEQPFWNVSPGELLDQLREGRSNSIQNVHCWLILENHVFLDATIIRDFYRSNVAGELTCYGELDDGNGNYFKYVPMLAGLKYFELTNYGNGF